MKLYTFMGNSPAEALQKAQQVCGKEALVVSTKQIKKKSLSSPALHEVVVALENREEEPKIDLQDLVGQKRVIEPTTQENSTPLSRIRSKSDSVILELSSQAKALSERTSQSQTKKAFQEQPKQTITPQLSKMQQALEQMTQAPHAQPENVQREIETLHQKLDTLTSLIWEEKREHRENFVVPPEFAHIYQITKKSGISPKHLEEIMRATIQEMPSYMKNSPTTITRYFQVLLQKMVPIRQERLLLDAPQTIMMFVGPTGVGKTTSLAKLAARYAFLSYSYKVGIVTLDSYRIGAVEQLYTYAKMMKLPIESALDSYDFKRALDRLSDCDIILVDTVGSSPYDRQKLSKLAQVAQESGKKIDASLVLSATTKREDLEEIYDNYSLLPLDNAIITKFDESRRFGNIFSFSLETNLPLSYICVGQEVPDDLMSASSDFLVDAIFHGYKKEMRV